jgi:hypothetical protein
VRLRLRDWRVQTKLTAVLLIPAVAFLVVAGLQATLSVRQAAALGEFADQVALGQQVTLLVHELQFERDWAAGQLLTPTAAPRDRAALADAMAAPRQAVAEARAAFDAAAAPLRDRPNLRASLAQANAALDELAAVRVGMAEGWLRRPAVFDGYSNAIESLQALLPVAAATEQIQLRGYQELAEVKELTAQLRGQVHTAVSAGGLRPGDGERLADLRAQRRAALDRFRATASPAQLARFDEAIRGQAVRATARLEQAVLERQEVAPQQWWSAATTELELLREVEAALLAEAQEQTVTASRDGWRQTITVTAVAVVIIVASLLLSVVIGRSMVRSLRLLRRQAVNVAQVQLPGLLERLRTIRAAEPIPEPAILSTASTRDEVGEVAEAFTQVHRSAVRLAAEQAQMRRNANKIYINLARRSQILVERQLELLDDLERDETNATQLASLFRLDHLATRMRRNNESLLVLTDSDPARRHDQPVQLAAVALAAIAEIERYQRVRDHVTAELHVAAHVAADLVHLLAELLDNATAFSAPDSTVVLTGHRVALPDGAVAFPDGAMVEITDSGIGMSPGALQEANSVLEDPPVIDVATSVQMGLVVVAHLAARHRIRVRLDASARGTTATVWLPSQLLAPAPDNQPLPAPPGVPLAGARAHTPVRAEDVLGDAHIPVDQDSVWWSRHPTARRGPVPAAATDSAGPAVDPALAPALAPAVAPAVGATAQPVAGGSGSTAAGVPAGNRTSANGLPIRVPLAQLPATGVGIARVAPPPAVELDPETVGGTLSSFYGGVHLAETEEGGSQPRPTATSITGGP